MNKRLVSSMLGVFVLAFLLVASPVLAAEVDVEAENNTTGADSTNENLTDVNNEGDVDVDNDGDVDNVASANLNTGDNEENMNTEGGDTDTGDIDASTDWESVLNEGFGLCGCPDSDDGDEYGADFLNEVTGYNSENVNELLVNNEGDLDIDNVADILNSLGLTANTGRNESNMNTEGGNIDTGDVDVMAAATNVANVATGSGSGDGGSSVDVDAENSTTGAESTNNNNVEIDNSGDTTLNNDADFSNVVSVNANTGENESNKNTEGGDIDTGDVDVETDIVNVANVGDCDCPSGNSVDVDAELANEKTGYDSSNTNTVDVDNTGNTTVDNDADVSNVLSVTADTGNNESNKNTEGGDTDTGSISVDFTSSTTVNSTD